MKKIFYLFIVFLMIFSCKEEETHKDAIARVNNVYLYEKDFINSLPNTYTKEDSILFRSNFINSWAKEQLLLQKAKLNIDTKKEIDQMVLKYKKELLKDKYKEALLKQNLDTSITAADIDRYYEQNKNIYKLNERLLKIKYIYFNKDISDKKELIKNFKSDAYEDIELLNEEHLKFISSNLNDSIWISYKDVRKKLPFLNEQKKLKKIKFLQKEDSIGVYLVAVKDVLYRNDIAPKSYVEPVIRQMILHKRKLQLIKEIEKTLLEDATKNKQFETYRNE